MRFAQHQAIQPVAVALPTDADFIALPADVFAVPRPGAFALRNGLRALQGGVELCGIQLVLRGQAAAHRRGVDGLAGAIPFQRAVHGAADVGQLLLGVIFLLQGLCGMRIAAQAGRQGRQNGQLDCGRGGCCRVARWRGFRLLQQVADGFWQEGDLVIIQRDGQWLRGVVQLLPPTAVRCAVGLCA